MRAVSRRLAPNALLRATVPDDLLRVKQLFNTFPKFPGSEGLREIKDFSEVPKESRLLSNDSLPIAQAKVLRSTFLKKFKGFTAYNPRKEAKDKFLAYELRCRSSNQAIRRLRGGGNPYLQAVLLTAQHKISKVLGRFDFEELLRVSRWGPGVTSSCKGLDVSSSAKFTSRPDVTREFLSRGRLLMPLLPSWSALLADQDYGVICNPMMPVVRGNRISFVPKTAKVHRVIAVEPHVNVFFQNGLGQMIRRRLLKRASIDLNDQSLNQRLAKLGSLTNDLATIDLEGASDTICIELVRDLLPEDWFSWLDAARSHRGTLDNEEIRYEKFSSMGNGATFDLESLIFWALSSAVVDIEGYNSYWVNVFGDDIVIPSGCYGKVTEVLESVGFLVNKEKSFHDGPFRESCGKDYFRGVDVRGIYLKDRPSVVFDWIKIANQIRLLAHRWAQGNGCDRRLKPAWDYALKQIPEKARRFVPKGFESNGLIGNWDEASPTLKSRLPDGWEGYAVKAFGVSPIKRLKQHRSLVTSGVHKIGEAGNMIPLRDRTKYREVSLLVPEWHDVGPWV